MISFEFAPMIERIRCVDARRELVRGPGWCATETGDLGELLFKLSRGFRRAFLSRQRRMYSADIGSAHLLILASSLKRRPSHKTALEINRILRTMIRVRNQWNI